MDNYFEFQTVFFLFFTFYMYFLKNIILVTHIILVTAVKSVNIENIFVQLLNFFFQPTKNILLCI